MPLESLSAEVRGAQRGFTLVELMVSLAILSIIAMMAVPYVEMTVRREREAELRSDLRLVRRALDQFHDDWEARRILRDESTASLDGYPRNLQVLVDGVPDTGPITKTRRYLRGIPVDPFSDNASDAWILRSYQDAPGALHWGGQDVYDLHSASREEAIDGSRIHDW